MINLIIKCLSLITKLDVTIELKFTGIKNENFYYHCDNKNIDKIDQFINSLSNNKNCIYEECYDLHDVYKYFSIKLINNIIKIKRGDVEINLINVMKKYLDLLNTYVK